MGRRGFTLVELMVALAVAGMVLGAAYGVLGAAADARVRAAAGRRAALAAPAARAALDGWLRSASLLDGAADFAGTPGGAPGLPRDELRFAVEDGGALYPGPRRVHLRVEEGRGLVAVLAPLSPYDPGPPDTLVLAPAAGGLHLRYRTHVRERPAWVEAWRSETALPEGVEAALVPAPGATLPRTLRLPLRIPLRFNPDASDADAGRGT